MNSEVEIVRSRHGRPIRTLCLESKHCGRLRMVLANSRTTSDRNK